jgi:cytochrome c oxidase cbb3-type subunit 3
MRMLRILVLASAVLGTAVSAQAQEPSANAVKLYDTYCVQCHGINRDGNGVNNPDMAVKPRDHTDSKAMGDTPDELLFKAIKSGGLSVSKSVLMPTWGGVLNDEEIHDLVAYLRKISNTQTN